MTHQHVAVTVLAVGALALGQAVPLHADPSPTTGTDGSINASYSNRAKAPQSRGPAAMRRYLSTVQPRFDLQSFVFFGSLIDTSGQVHTFSTMTQTQLLSTPPTVGTVSVNSADSAGTAIGGLDGVQGSSVSFTLGAHPWRAAVQPLPAPAPPRFVDAQIVKGKVGQRGAVYELTASVNGVIVGKETPTTLDTTVRAKDMTGWTQWGYGPSGFFPQWLYPKQRKRVMGRFGGSVERYLETTGASLTGQGDYYYSAPLLRVTRYSVAQDGQVVSRGNEGYLWLDNVNQSFDTAARAIVDNGVQWLEFSVQLPGTRQALKIGRVSQDSVGTLPYAILSQGDGERWRDGLLEPVARWDIGDIAINPVKSSAWTSPISGLRYYTKYDVVLDGDSPRDRGHLRISATFDDQEIALPSRTVYEGLFSVKGRIRGQQVAGQSWAEIQPS